jgi:hypothetical protein
MATSPNVEAVQLTERFFGMLKSLNEFDDAEIKGVIDTLVSPSEREKCFIANYIRCRGNVSTLLELKARKHFQGIAMLARSMFELAVDLKLIDVIRDSCEKMIAFVDIEKLKCARKAIQFATDNPGAKVDTSIFDSFVMSERGRIDSLKSKLWPSGGRLVHWSAMDLSRRVQQVKEPFEEMYALYYGQLSWQVHSGLTGVINLKAETFTLMCGQGFKLAVDSYSEVLSTIISEFKIENANRKSRKR